MRIVNLNHRPAPPWIYAGRKMIGDNPREGSPLGSPFKLAGKSPADIAACLRQYREWLWEKIKANDKQIMALFREMNDQSVLACYCVDLTDDAIFTSPERCHTQVCWKAWKHVRETF